MSDAYARLRDALAPRRAPDASSFATDPRRIKAWADALPRANQQATLKRLADALDSIKGLRLDGLQRLQALETLRPTILDGVVLLERSLQGSAFPLPPGKALIAEQIQAFQRGLSESYRIALVEVCAPAGGIPFLKSAPVALLLERALYHGGRDLALSYFLYRTPTPGTWLALNSLYRYAQELRLEDKASEEPAEGMSLAPRQVYAQALLFALSNPYRFSQREQAELWPITRDLAARVELLPRRPTNDAFALAQLEDRGPGYLPEERAAEAGSMLWMGMAPLRAALEAALVVDGSGPVHVRFRHGPAVVAPAEHLRRLRSGWGQAATRGFQRLSAGHSLDTVIGLSALHYYLSGHLDFDSFMRQVRGVSAVEGGTQRATWAQSNAETGRIPIVVARVLDQSLGGYRLSWKRDETLRARVGELVGVAVSGDAEARDWMVGVIRWLRYDPQGEVDAGIELLARRAQAVGLRSVDRAGAPRAPLRAIQIDCLRPNGQGSLHFLAPSMLDVQAPRIEVSRALDADAFEPASAPVEQCSDILVLENAGDYYLLAAQPVGTA